MMRGLYKATGYWNTVEARKDWARIEKQALDLRLTAEVEKLRPAANAGWRTIDKRIAKLRIHIQQADVYCECDGQPYFTTNEAGHWICDKCGGYHE